ncbi:unnamed protein product [Onchocerca flexuosa]|uniref:Pentatricopeptide repeat-containing protein n=1 Tax=Onchocerca flexuosa TaxID=387005 RepID=A0A183H0B0_9BILA|nr:unnamed protein product [Onchocerca flexuosa]
MCFVQANICVFVPRRCRYCSRVFGVEVLNTITVRLYEITCPDFIAMIAKLFILKYVVYTEVGVCWDFRKKILSGQSAVPHQQLQPQKVASVVRKKKVGKNPHNVPFKISNRSKYTANYGEQLQKESISRDLELSQGGVCRSISDKVATFEWLLNLNKREMKKGLADGSLHSSSGMMRVAQKSFEGKEDRTIGWLEVVRRDEVKARQL